MRERLTTKTEFIADSINEVYEMYNEVKEEIVDDYLQSMADKGQTVEIDLSITNEIPNTVSLGKSVRIPYNVFISKAQVIGIQYKINKIYLERRNKNTLKHCIKRLAEFADGI